jgi:hypothetical protein
MPAPRPKLRGRLLVVGGLVLAGVAALVLFSRYGLHRLAQRLRNRH